MFETFARNFGVLIKFDRVFRDSAHMSPKIPCWRANCALEHPECRILLHCASFCPGRTTAPHILIGCLDTGI